MSHRTFGHRIISGLSSRLSGRGDTLASLATPAPFPLEWQSRLGVMAFPRHRLPGGCRINAGRIQLNSTRPGEMDSLVLRQSERCAQQMHLKLTASSIYVDAKHSNIRSDRSRVFIRLIKLSTHQGGKQVVISHGSHLHHVWTITKKNENR